jgi:hypothetical protein
MGKSKNIEKNSAYITIGKSLCESLKDSNIPNKEYIDAIGKGLIDTIKPIADYNLKIAKICAEEILQKQKTIETMIEPLSAMAKKIIETYEPILYNTGSIITEVFEKIDWSQYDLIYKEIAIKYLSNGFYPYRDTKVTFENLVNTNNDKKLIKIIKDGVKIDIINNKNNLVLIYPQYKKEIKEIYKLYKNHSYRLCILSIINLVSVINNQQFEYIDFTQRKEIRKKLLEKQIMREKETNYLLFSPYINDEVLKNENILLKNCNNKDYMHPKEYCKIPFNRNAILHGYVEKFGNETNCLRWFSVLFNTMEISLELI